MNDQIGTDGLQSRKSHTPMLVMFALVGIILVIVALKLHSFQQARERGCWTRCQSNLRMIDSAKVFASQELNLVPRDTVPTDKMLNYMAHGEMVTCPSGGKYRIGMVNEEPRCSLHGSFGDDQIHTAAAIGDVAGIKKQIADHYSVDQRSDDEWTPLHSAAFGSQAEAIEFLLSKGADPNARTRLNETPLDLATDPKVLTILRQHGGIQSVRPSEPSSKTIAIVKGKLSLVLNHEFALPNRYKFNCRLINDGDKRISVKVVESSVTIEAVIRRGAGSTGGSSSSLGELCPIGTEFVVEPRKEHAFDWSCEHTVGYTLRNGKVVSESTTFKTQTAESGSGTGSVSGGPSVEEMNDSTWVSAVVFIHAEMEGSEPVELSIQSERYKYLVKDPTKVINELEETVRKNKGEADP
jgi:hypothetical protein